MQEIEASAAKKSAFQPNAFVFARRLFLMLAHVLSSAVLGIDAYLITVEIDVSVHQKVAEPSRFNGSEFEHRSRST